MVCIECNGKGYRIVRGREVVCDECRGRGEYLPEDGDRPREAEPRKAREAC